MAYKMSVDDAIVILNDLMLYPENITQDQAEAVAMSLRAFSLTSG